MHDPEIERTIQKKQLSFRELFHVLAHRTSEWVGSPTAFLLAIGVIVVWAVTGPIFHYSDTWQLVINTGTTIITFLMVFLIQNTQNRDARAIHLKLDELIRCKEGARNYLMGLEEMSDEEMKTVRDEFEKMIESECKRRAQKKSARTDGRSMAVTRAENG